MAKENFEKNVENWLKTVLKTDNVTDVSLEIEGINDKGAGYVGDVFFVEALLNHKNGTTKNTSLALKCSKKSQALRESTPIKEIFENEIYIYKTVIPEFQKFQKEHKIPGVFDAVPKYFGSFVTENMEIIAFENLKKTGFSLWDKRKPLTRKHIDLLMEKYGEFHAISAAINDQNPKFFEKLVNNLEPVFEEFTKNGDFSNMVGQKIDLSCELLKNEIDEKTLENWAEFREKIDYIIRKMFDEKSEFKVLTHGDCWGNNFMYKQNIVGNEVIVEDVKMLDWQIAKYNSPISDLSYFLFASISEKDLQDLDTILDNYYATFSKTLEKLGSKPENVYTYKQFKNDWKKFAKYGIAMSPGVYFVCSTETDEVLDIGDIADEGENFMKTFDYEIKDNSVFKNRSKTLIEFVVKNKLI